MKLLVLLAISSNDMDLVCPQVRPQVSGKLVLKLEYSGSHAIFLDLDITINNGKISTKLYDKRNNFFLYFTHAKLSYQHSITYFLYNFYVQVSSYCKIIFFCCKFLCKKK